MTDVKAGDWLDQPIESISLVQCSRGYWEDGHKKGCTRLLTTGSPKTPRQLIEVVESFGWMVEVVGERRIKFTCGYHILERLAEL